MTDIFKNKTPDFNKLIEYGFSDNGDFFEFSANILNGDFKVNIKVFKNGETKTETLETFSNEPYTLHLVEGAKGTFIGQVREEYEKILEDIAEKCFDTEVFKSKTTKQVIKYIEGKYKNNAEYLWEKFPENAVFRRKDNQKWYAAILTVKRDRLGFDSDEIVEVIDLRAQKEDVSELIKQDNIYPGWHMNKKSWITIILDGSMPFKDIQKYIDSSYLLAKK